MRKVLFFSILILSFCGSCFAQNSNSETRRFLGTWKTQMSYMNQRMSITFTFNDNGNASISVGTGGSQNNIQTRYIIIGSKFIMKSDDGADACDYYFSSDGKILVLGGLSILGNSMAIWLDKQ